MQRFLSAELQGDYTLMIRSRDGAVVTMKLEASESEVGDADGRMLRKHGMKRAQQRQNTTLLQQCLYFWFCLSLLELGALSWELRSSGPIPARRRRRLPPASLRNTKTVSVLKPDAISSRRTFHFIQSTPHVGLRRQRRCLGAVDTSRSEMYKESR